MPRPSAPFSVSPLLVCAGLLSAACRSQVDCAQLADPVEQDWCRVDAAVTAVRSGDTPAALAQIGLVQDTTIRAAGINSVLPLADGLTTVQVEALCDGLGDAQAIACRRTWGRAHLWENRDGARIDL